MRRMVRWFAPLLVMALVGVACGDDDDDGEAKEPPKKTTTTAAEVARPTFDAGTTMAALQEKGKIVVGTKFDQPGFGLKSAKGVEGFDVEIAKLIAVAIFGGTTDDVEDKIEFVEAVSKNREPFIQEGKVDIVVATYTINDVRKQVVDFAGPYFLSHQDVMVKKANTDITSVDDLNGKKVCSVQGSTSLTNLQAKAPQADTSITFDAYSLCADAMADGRVDAVTTDDVLLLGLVVGSGGEFKLVGAPFTDEPLGIGLTKGDTAFRNFLNSRIEEIEESGEWAAAFEATLGKLDLETPEPPPVVRYQ